MKLKSLLTLGAIASALTFSVFGCDDDNKENALDTLKKYVDSNCKTIDASDTTRATLCKNTYYSIDYYKGLDGCADEIAAELKNAFIDKMGLTDQKAQTVSDDEYNICLMNAFLTSSKKSNSVNKAISSFCKTQLECESDNDFSKYKQYADKYQMTTKDFFISYCFMISFDDYLQYKAVYPLCKKELDTFYIDNNSCHAQRTCEEIENDGDSCVCNDKNQLNVDALETCVDNKYPD